MAETRKPLTPARAAAALLVLVLWASFLDFPRFVAGPELDESWQQALGYFFKHRLRAGVDYVFTYGPLGYFATRAYDADLFALKCAWELGVKLLAALAVVGVGWRLPPLVRAVFFAAVLFLPDHPDALYALFVVLLVVVPLLAGRWTGVRIAGCAAMLGVLALTKFSLFLLGAAGAVTLAASLMTEGRRASALLAAAFFLVGLGAAWCAAGQSLGGLPTYLHASWEITRGYAEAMADGEPGGDLALAAAVLFLFMVAAGFVVRQSPGRAAVLVFLALGLFMQWKHAFLRPGNHVPNFFAFAALAPLACWPLLRTERLPRWTVGFLAVPLGLALFGRFAYDPLASYPLRLVRERFQTVADNVQAVLFPSEYQGKMADRQDVLREQWSLPRTRAEVGDAAIDVISFQQGVLLLNGLRYRPRPVFQSYSAYTSFLLAANARFYRGDAAPAYVLLRLEPIDDRLPASEDAPALLEVLRRYRPVLVEKSFLLLKRGEHAGPTAGPVVHEQRLRLGEEARLDHLDAGEQVLALDVAYSAWGAMRTLLYRPPPLFVHLRFDEGDERRYRLIPALAEGGFLLNPFIESEPDVLRYYEGAAGRRARSIRVSTADDEAAPASYQDEVRLVIRPVR